MHDLKFLATNNLSAKGLFYTRSAYKKYAVPEDSLRVVDYWYGDSLYGKVDFNNDVVYPVVNKTNMLETIKQNTKSVLSLFFVSRQVEKLKNEYGALLDISQGTINPLPAYKDFQVSRSYADPDNLYEEHITSVLRYFVLEYLPQFSRCILSFEDLVEHYKKFVSEFASKFPVTKSNFIMLPTTTPLITGLVVDLEHSKHSEDKLKEDFFKECDFQAFQSLAASNGLLVDKNAPWRLTANVRSDTIYKGENIFGKYYQKAFKQDLHSVFRFVLNSYKLFFRKNPNVFYPVVSREGSMKNIIKKRQIDKSFLDKYGSDYWLGLTYWTRLNEIGIKERSYLQSQFNEKPWRSQNSEDLSSCLRLINEKVKLLDKRLAARPLHSQNINKGSTTTDEGHNHRYEVDEYGNGWALEVSNPNDPGIYHRHKIERWVVQESSSDCYPHCAELRKSGEKGVRPHIHETRF